MSESFNIFEKNLARVLSNAPFLKRIIKISYSRIFYFLKKKDYKVKSVSDVSVIHDGEQDTFFGYYDKAPDNGNGLVLVYSSIHSTKNAPNNIESITLDVYDIKKKDYILPIKIDIKSFNWQQGSRAHWLTADKFVYNNYDSNSKKYRAYVYSVELSKIVSILDKPVQDSFCDNYMLSICYETLAILRPDYGYFSEKNISLPLYSDVGIWKCDYISSKCELLFSVEDVIHFCFDNVNENHMKFKHKLNHVMISPNGKFFIFMHRYYNKSGKRFDRLILANVDGELLRVLCDDGMVSHCFWYDDDTILGYLRGPNGVDAYWLINIKNSEHSVFNNGVFDGIGDGHPSINGLSIITDTYPDKARMQSLYLTKKGLSKYIKLGEFFHGFDFGGETRCDLHPRFSKDGSLVFFDSIYSGRRNLCYLDIKSCEEDLFFYEK
ncbi:glycosyl transferase [Psychromonas sp.]|nr:glycosyl transferase [Psychromonas sp.]